jgi:hypothetical protein
MNILENMSSILSGNNILSNFTYLPSNSKFRPSLFEIRWLIQNENIYDKYYVLLFAVTLDHLQFFLLRLIILHNLWFINKKMLHNFSHSFFFLIFFFFPQFNSHSIRKLRNGSTQKKWEDQFSFIVLFDSVLRK